MRSLRWLLPILLVLTAACACVIIMTRPPQLPNDGELVKIVSTHTINEYGYVDSIRVQRGIVDAPEFEWRVNYETCGPKTGEVGTYNRHRLDFDSDYIRWNRSQNGYDTPCRLNGNLPADPLHWLHNKENSLGVVIFGGIALLIPVALVIGIFAWLAPIYIAKKRGHPNFMPITVITILLGWTFIGWAVCLAWSLSSIKNSQELMPGVVTK